MFNFRTRIYGTTQETKIKITRHVSQLTKLHQRANKLKTKIKHLKKKEKSFNKCKLI